MGSSGGSGGGGGGGITLEEANTGLSAEGADPITALADQLAAASWNDGSFDRVTVYADGSGIKLFDSAGNFVAQFTDSSWFISDSGLSATAQVLPGELRLQDDGLVNRVQMQSDGSLHLSDAVATQRVALLDDGTGLTLYDSGGNQVAQFSEDSASLKKASVHLSAANILTLDSVPFQLVAAQGAGTVVMPHAVFSQTIVGAVPFDDPATPDVVYGSDTNPLNTNSQIDIGGIVSDSTGFSTQFSRNSDVMENAALNLLNLGAPASPANGDTTIWITVYYTVETLH